MHIFIQWKTWQTSVMCTTTITTAMRIAYPYIFCARKTYFKTIFLLPMRKIRILLFFAWNIFYLLASALHVILYYVFTHWIYRKCALKVLISHLCTLFHFFLFLFSWRISRRHENVFGCWIEISRCDMKWYFRKKAKWNFHY